MSRHEEEGGSSEHPLDVSKGPLQRVMPRALSRLRTFESFGTRDFRIFWVSMIAQWMAMNMQMLARNWFMYDLTTSALLLGLTGAATGIPMVVFSPLGGALADRVGKRTLLTGGSFLLSLVALAIAIVISLGLIKWWYLLIGSVCQGTISALMIPSRQSAVPQLVGEDKVLNAVSLNAAGQNVARLVGPALAGFLVAPIGVDGVYYVISACFFVAGFSMLFLPPLPSVRGAQRRPMTRDIVEGLRYVRGDVVILLLLLMAFVTVILAMPLNLLLPVFTEEVLGVGPDKLGLLMSMIGVGSLIGAVLVASLGGFRRKGLLLLVLTMFLGGAICAFSFSRSYVLAALLMIPVGLGQVGRMVLNNALVLTNTPPAFQGRVMSLYMMAWGLQPLGTLPMGAIADAVGIAPVFAVASSILVLFCLGVMTFTTRIRRLP